MGFTTLVSRVFGLGRTVLLAHIFGASLIGDLFFLAFKIPNLLRRTFAEGAMSSCFVPLYQEIKKYPPFINAHQVFFRKILTLTFLIVSSIVLLGMVGSSFVMEYFFFLSQKEIMPTQTITLGSILLRIMFPYLLFISCTAIIQGFLNSNGSFSKPAMTPIILNVTIIAGAIYALMGDLPLEVSAKVIASAVTVGGVLQLGFLLPSVYRLKTTITPVLTGMPKESKRFFLLMGPVIFSSGIYQINQIVVDPIVISLGKGAISALQYSVRLQELPIGALIVSLTTVSLPSLSNMTKEKTVLEFQKRFNEIIRFLVLPLSIIIPVGIVSREDIIYLLFKSGNFDLDAVRLTANCLTFHLIALLPIGFHRMLNNAFFAFQDTQTPFWISFYSLPVNIIFAYTLSVSMKLGPPGIALAMACSTLFSVLLMYYYMKKKLSLYITTDTYYFLGKILAITFVLLISIYAYSQFNSLSFFPFESKDSLVLKKLAKAINFISLAGIYGLFFSLLCLLFKVQEITLIKKIFIK